MTPEDRAAAIGSGLEQIKGGWPFLQAELTARRDALVARLISSNDDEVRGRIKALDDVLNLPEVLHQERLGITAGLADDAPAL